ncbi:MAG: hypothetical protein Q9182_005203 [Xanthomendoza sp. 2 TL-2023]
MIVKDVELAKDDRASGDGSPMHEMDNDRTPERRDVSLSKRCPQMNVKWDLDRCKITHTLQNDSNITDIIIEKLLAKLQTRQYPKTICPSEIPRAFSKPELTAMGFSDWRDMMPPVRAMLFDMRSKGQVEILQKGEVIPSAMTLEAIHGPIRARLVPSDES